MMCDCITCIEVFVYTTSMGTPNLSYRRPLTALTTGFYKQIRWWHNAVWLDFLAIAYNGFALDLLQAFWILLSQRSSSKSTENRKSMIDLSSICVDYLTMHSRLHQVQAGCTSFVAPFALICRQLCTIDDVPSWTLTTIGDCMVISACSSSPRGLENSFPVTTSLRPGRRTLLGSIASTFLEEMCLTYNLHSLLGSCICGR